MCSLLIVPSNCTLVTAITSFKKSCRSSSSNIKQKRIYTFAFADLGGAAGLASADLQLQAQRRVPQQLAWVRHRELVHRLRLRLHHAQHIVKTKKGKTYVLRMCNAYLKIL